MKKILCVAAVSLAAVNVAYAEHHEGKKEKMMAPPELTGAFSSPEGWVATFMPAGYLVVANDMGVAGVIVKYGAKDGMIWFKDLTPPSADEEAAHCAMTKKGKYSYAEDDGALSFTLVEDPCSGRAEAVAAASLSRMEMPEPAAE
ncbi:hypothetical protein PUV54_08725 [Hyphococcus flavus]|uniref:Uncharacterized protein n=1 Tax=Hyphococcus flavus TaxID=1866326 RepID=A0AAF0CDP7_9PROT|nr:hypothetical protein [Hyphococcus flavus]WDI30041.1 hypothetical protein PUV54_08725 [Hyphococcus flavus]